MNTHDRLDYFMMRPDVIRLKAGEKWVFSSDAHRGCRDKADDFQKNEAIWLTAMSYYFKEGFVLCEPGDHDDNWECEDYRQIQSAYPALFDLLQKFDRDDRYDPISGNHDKELGHPEAIVLQRTGFKALVIHGNQGDWWTDGGASVGKWFTRNVWRRLQWLGFKDPTSAQKKNPKKHERTKATLKEWAKTRKTILICGHTHFQETGADGYYWNCGSSVGDGVECVELWADNSLHLVRWTSKGRKEV